MTTMTLTRCLHDNRTDHNVEERQPAFLGGQVIQRNETWNCPDCGGWLYKETHLNAADPRDVIADLPLKVIEHVGHPAWCDAHTGHTDGSEDWHSCSRVTIASYQTYLSSGTNDGSVAVWIDSDEVSIADARALGQRLVALADAAEVDR